MIYVGNILYNKILLETDKKLIIFGTGNCDRKLVKNILTRTI